MLSRKTTGTGSIQIALAEAGQLKVLLPYSPDRIAKIKGIKNRRWHAEGRYWTVPRAEGTLAHLLTLFAGEPVEIEPSLRAVGVPANPEPPPEPATRQAVAPLPSSLTRYVRRLAPGIIAIGPRRLTSGGSAAFSYSMTSAIRQRWGPSRSRGF